MTPPVAVQLTVRLNAGQFLLDVGDPLSSLPPVGLQLCLTGSTQTDAADRLAGKVRPHTGQPWQPVLQLRELDL